MSLTPLLLMHQASPAMSENTRLHVGPSAYRPLVWDHPGCVPTQHMFHEPLQSPGLLL